MRHLKIEFLENSKTWYDRDWILFNSMFQILVDFVEKEFVCDWWIDWDHSDKSKHIKSEILDLYDWFIENYNNDKLSDEYFYNNKFCKEQLKRIIDIMGYMWT